MFLLVALLGRNQKGSRVEFGTVLKAVLVVDCVSLGVLVFESLGYASAPAAFCVTGMNEKGS